VSSAGCSDQLFQLSLRGATVDTLLGQLSAMSQIVCQTSNMQSSRGIDDHQEPGGITSRPGQHRANDGSVFCRITAA
jgi:hypothetical protein